MRRSNSDRVAEAIREGGRLSGMSIRQLARVSGVSPAQVNRLRAGEANTTRETLVRVARAFDRNPNLLFIAAGLLDGDEARQILGSVFQDGSEHVEVWKHAGRKVAQTRREIADPGTSDDALAELALQVFLDPESEDNLWHDPFLGSVIEGTDSPLIREVLRDWAYLTPERKSKVVGYVRDQAELARHESADDIRKEIPDYGKP
jgi:transcriptional regulator with XRE-family HTH domain